MLLALTGRVNTMPKPAIITRFYHGNCQDPHMFNKLKQFNGHVFLLKIEEINCSGKDPHSVGEESIYADINTALDNKKKSILSIDLPRAPCVWVISSKALLGRLSVYIA